MTSFPTDFPDSSRLWVFPLNKSLSDAMSFRQSVEQFVSGWKAHGTPLKAKVEIIDDQIVLIAADESTANASGCSIDSLTREITKLSSEQGLNPLSGSEVIFKQDGNWKAVSRAQFQKLISSGAVDSSTLVADATLTSVGDFRVKGVVKACAQSWHAKAFNF